LLKLISLQGRRLKRLIRVVTIIIRSIVTKDCRNKVKFRLFLKFCAMGKTVQIWSLVSWLLPEKCKNSVEEDIIKNQWGIGLIINWKLELYTSTGFKTLKISNSSLIMVMNCTWKSILTKERSTGFMENISTRQASSQIIKTNNFMYLWR